MSLHSKISSKLHRAKDALAQPLAKQPDTNSASNTKTDDSASNSIVPGEAAGPPQPTQQASRMNSAPRASENTDASPSHSNMDNEPDFVAPSPMTSAIPENEIDPSADKADIAALLPAYGSSSATAWLEHDRYRVWRLPVSAPVRESTFAPAQGYFRADPYIFAWGNPLVSSPAALVPTVAAFWTWCKQQNLRLVWCCVDGHMERVLGASGSEFGWSTVSCISEDVVDPKEVVDIVDAPGGGSTVKDLKKNLRRAERENVVVREVKHDEWTEEHKRTVEEGIQAWKKSRTGIQIAATSFQPWIDFEHRRFWVAEKDSVIIGILILSPVRPASYQIKNAVAFPNAPRGTAERLIYSAMHDLQDVTHLDPRAPEIQDQQSLADKDVESSTPLFFEKYERTPPESSATPTSDSHASIASVAASETSVEASNGRSSATSSTASTPDRHSHSASPSPESEDDRARITVTFGISAADKLTPVGNLSGWKVSWLSKAYGKVVGATGLVRRGNFRDKFQAEHMPMYVCYPTEDGFGLDGINALIKCLRQ